MRALSRSRSSSAARPRGLWLLAFMGVATTPAPVAADGAKPEDAAAATEPADAVTDAAVEEAIRGAGEGGPLALVIFSATWCKPCHKLAEKTLPDDEVRAWIAARAVLVKVDADLHKAVVARYGARSFPTLLLLAPDGSERARIVGYATATKLLAHLDASLTGKDATDRAKERAGIARWTSFEGRFEYGRALADRGRPAEALVEYAGCLDRSIARAAPVLPGPRPVAPRFESLLAAIVLLGRTHAPAVEALRARRDSVERKLLDPATTGDLAADAAAVLVALDRALVEPARTLATYDALLAVHADRAAARAALLDEVIDPLLEARRWAVVLADGKERRRTLEGHIADLAPGGMGGSPDLPPRLLRKAAFEDGARFLAALLGTGARKEALALVRRLAACEPTDDEWEALAAAARSAGAADVEREILARAARAGTAILRCLGSPVRTPGPRAPAASCARNSQRGV